MWQTITTVPKDTRVFLAYDGSHPEYDDVASYGVGTVWTFDVRLDGFIDNIEIEDWGWGAPPTHWMPIPDLPKL